VASDAERMTARDVAESCVKCFPSGTLVATPHGKAAIDKLHVGDTVLSEDPKTGTVESEPVRHVIKDPVSPLIAVDLSDGGAITVTADHPFWIDAGAHLSGPGWLPAGQLRAGDKLRTADGRDAVVTGLRQHVGKAVVYTLTVARDHTYFVGADRVLVHNCFPVRDATGHTTVTLSGDWKQSLPQGGQLRWVRLHSPRHRIGDTSEGGQGSGSAGYFGGRPAGGLCSCRGSARRGTRGGFVEGAVPQRRSDRKRTSRFVGPSRI